MNRKLFAGLRITVVVIAGVAGPGARAATFLVTTTNDSGAGSLRQAMLDANVAGGLDTISFQIPGAGVRTIAPASALPPLTDPVVIDATTQPGYAGQPLVELNGQNAGLNAGLRLLAGGSTVKGLAINRFGTDGIDLQGPGTNVIRGNFIGTDPAGNVGRGNAREGIYVQGSAGNLIGGTSPSDRNVISGNGDAGVYLLNAAGNVIQGNRIGTTGGGTTDLGNANNGVTLYQSAGNLIGGSSVDARNVISGNNASGVYLFGAGSAGNLVQGNFIGTDASGSTAISNSADGVTIDGAGGNTIGGTNTGLGNVISGNGQSAVYLSGAGAANNCVQGNWIGTDATGRLALGNGASGLTLSGAPNNVIGGGVAPARNIISGNKLDGVFITTNSFGNSICGNYIGADGTGTRVLGNGFNGVEISSASGNVIGGSSTGSRNVISGNTNNGIGLFAGAAGNVAQGNYIGTDAAGRAALANGLSGVRIESSANTIGGSASGAGNLISGNGRDGIFVFGSGASSNSIQGNLVGTASGGSMGLKNNWNGIQVLDAPGTEIGGTAAGAGNLVSANGLNGVRLGGNAHATTLKGNYIGTDAGGMAALGNAQVGIYVDQASTNAIGGPGAGEGNLISANKNWGIYLTNSTSWNRIQGNLVGTKIDGASNLGNGVDVTGFHAVELRPGCRDNLIGGPGPGEGNRIAFAPNLGGVAYAGVRVRDGATNNAILGNAIFSNAGLGIDLGAAGVSANDPCDADSGANQLQNYPVLTQAVSGDGTGVRGSLNSKAGGVFRIQFYASPTCDPLGNGEGQIFLGQITATTAADCAAAFVAKLPGRIPAGYAVTATATDSANNTSEFSGCVAVVAAPALRIGGHGDRQVSLVWSNAPGGFVLKHTASLTPPIVWTAVTNVPVLSNGQYMVTVAGTNSARFYLLSFE